MRLTYMLSPMKRTTRVTALLIAITVLVSLAGQRLVGAEFAPAAAHEPTTPSGATVAQVAAGTDSAPDTIVLERGRQHVLAAAEAAPVAEAAEAPVAVPVTAADPAPAAPAPVATPRPATQQASAPPAPVRTAAPTAPPAPTVAPSTPPATCPATWFCYPRLGIAGAIVPYTDCGGTTDIGTSIRSFTCLSPFYLMGHAYTQFGKITQWQAGDIVFASGRQFTITGAFTQSSCEAPARALAPLSLQTSLTSGGCGSVLVVQGN